jgi:NDP-sugar pyrophosphorylase family protein
MKLPDLLTQLVQQGATVRVIYTSGHWLDVDSVDDVVAGAQF